eukprot:scaffold15542_cov112-Isochrysis_galbana.AAC.3
MALGGRSRSRRPRTTATRYGRLSSQRNLDRRAKISVTLMPANATPSKCPDGPISGARRQGTLCRAHAHRASMPASCILPRTEIQSKLYAIVANRRKLAHSRSLCVARRAASSRGMSIPQRRLIEPFQDCIENDEIPAHASSKLHAATATEPPACVASSCSYSTTTNAQQDCTCALAIAHSRQNAPPPHSSPQLALALKIMASSATPLARALATSAAATAAATLYIVTDYGAMQLLSTRLLESTGLGR